MAHGDVVASWAIAALRAVESVLPDVPADNLLDARPDFRPLQQEVAGGRLDRRVRCGRVLSTLSPEKCAPKPLVEKGSKVLEETPRIYL
jgi:hypothetical protein